VWFNWSCGICWPLIESDNLCRNGFFVVSYLLGPSLTFVLLFFFFLGFQAPPPGKLSPDRDGASDADPDKKGLDSEMDMVGTSDSPIHLIDIVGWSIGNWVLIDILFLHYFCFRPILVWESEFGEERWRKDSQRAGY
jgi:hypothetical protein